MAQNEGRTPWSAPRISLKHVALFVVMLIAALLFGLAVHGLKAAAESALTVEISHETDPSTNQGLAAADGAQQAATKASKDNVPDCTPANYHLPTAVDIRNFPAGLTVVEDSLQQYTIYGNTAEQRVQQLQHCAPVGEFAGAASYQVTWEYAYSVRNDGLCQLVEPKVGLHLAMILPEWSVGAKATASDQAAWNDYIHALSVHEQGHYKLSRQYAQAMIDSLQHQPVQSCNNIKATTDALLASKMSQLKSAQDNYDSLTDHGATQGATL